MTVYIKPSHMPPDTTIEAIRSETTNKVLGRVGECGVYFWDRFSRMYHIVSWEKLGEMHVSHQSGRESGEIHGR